MDVPPINWNEVPDVITKEQFWRLCHISKSTARFLLKSGRVPCSNSGKKTRCYRILKSDVIAYLEDREQWPESYKASRNWYATNGKCAKGKETPIIREDLHEYYVYLLRNQPDVLATDVVCETIGYCKATVNRWCQTGLLKHFQIRGQNMIPKAYLIDFFCSPAFRTITRKSLWHKRVLSEYEKWKYRDK